MHISTQLYDSARSRPATGVRVRLARQDQNAWVDVATGTTDAGGRVAEWTALSDTGRGVFRLVYATNAYFAELGEAPFHPSITVEFVLLEDAEPCDIVVLVSPGSYVTYRAA